MNKYLEKTMQPIRFEEFLARTGLGEHLQNMLHTSGIQAVVSPRAISKINDLHAMPHEYLVQILSSVGLAGTPGIKVFRGAKIKCLRVDPDFVSVGQTFVDRQKYTSIMETFETIFRNFSVPRGISKLTAYIIFGRDHEGHQVLAHYLPPILEVHQGVTIAMDGIHRNFIVRQSGTTIESIMIDDVTVAFPCAVRSWDEMKVTDGKPERQEDRFFDLRPELFRDLKSVGIDG